MAGFSPAELVRRAAKAYSTARGVLYVRRKRAHADGLVTKSEAELIHEAERAVEQARKHLEKRKTQAGVGKLTVMKSPIFRTGGYGALGPITRVGVHHDAGRLRFTIPDMQAMIRAYDAQHMREYHGGIGYHEIIDAQGRIWPVRDEKAKGAHVALNNSNTYGIMLTGNFEDGTERPTEEQLDTLHARLTGPPPPGLPDLRGKLPYGHKEIINNSACPGRRFLPWIQALRARLS